MTDYRETSVSGTTYRRANGGGFRNPRVGIKRLFFLEEDVAILGDKEFSTPVPGEVGEELSSANAMLPFNIVDPETGAVLGQMTRYELYRALHSFYLTKDADRDAADAASKAAAEAFAAATAARNAAVAAARTAVETAQAVLTQTVMAQQAVAPVDSTAVNAAASAVTAATESVTAATAVVAADPSDAVAAAALSLANATLAAAQATQQDVLTANAAAIAAANAVTVAQQNLRAATDALYAIINTPVEGSEA